MKGADEIRSHLRTHNRNRAAYVSDLPGWATGRTRAEVERRIAEAIQLHVEALRAARDDVPLPTSSVGVVEAV
jgi:predicted RNase H-like HicB family nuclease